MTSKPTFVLVPGAWHRASTWDKVTALLEAQKYNCISVTLPSTTSNPSATFADDIAAVRKEIITETTKGRDVIVVVHSYGGLVGSSAIKDLTKGKSDTSTTTDKQSGHVIGIALMATGFNITGIGFLDGMGGKPPPIWKLDYESGFVTITVDPRELFYHDLSQEEGDFWVSKLTKQSIKSLSEGGEHSYAGWKDVPCWYLATGQDRGLPVQAQNMMVEMARGAGADVSVREVDSSHSPMLSKPKETADFLMDAAIYFAQV